MAYHSWLLKKSLYDRGWAYFAPRGPTNESFEKAIIIDLTMYSIKETETMQVTTEYNDSFSSERWFLMPITIDQHRITYNSKDGWLSEPMK
jgi:hypothetical protein